MAGSELKPFDGQLDSTSNNLTPFNGELDPPEAPKRSALDVAKDIGVTALKGAVGLPQSVVGVSDIVTGGRAGKVLEDAGVRFEETQKFLDDQYSDAQKAANREVQQAEGFVGTAKAMLENPSTIATSIGESVPQMLGGAGVARGVMKLAPKIGPAVAGALGEGVLGAGAQAEQIRQETEDGLLTPKQSALSAATGVATSAFGAAGGKIAQRLGIGDADTMLAQGALRGAGPSSQRSLARQVAEGALSEGVLEELPQSMSEQALQNLALDRPVGEDVGKAGAAGFLAGAAMGGGASLLHGVGGQRNAQPVQAPANDGSSEQLSLLPEEQATGPAPVGGLPAVEGGLASVQRTFDPRDPASQPPLDVMPTAPTDGVPFDAAPAAAAREIDMGGLALVNDEPPELPSQSMGLNPADGPLSTAAALAVDGGAHDVMNAAAQLAAQAEADESRAKTPTAAPAQEPGTLAQAVDAETGEISPQPAGRAAELQSRLDFVRQQAQANGWDQRLIAERDRAQAELAALTPAAAPASVQEGIAQARARRAEATDERGATAAPAESPAAATDSGTRPAPSLAPDPAASGLPEGRAPAPTVSAAKREKAMRRVEEGRAWFLSGEKAREFVGTSGLWDTHEVVPEKRRFVVKAKSQSAATRGVIDAGEGSARVRRLATGQAPVQQPEGQALEGLRGQGDQDGSRVGERLQGVSSPYGQEADPAPFTGPREGGRRLRPGELPVGDVAGASGESAVLPHGRLGGAENDDPRSRARDRNVPDDVAKSASSAGADADRGGEAGRTSVSPDLQASDTRRANNERSGVGKGARAEIADAARATAPRDATGSRADSSIAAQQPELNPSNAQKDANNYRHAHLSGDEVQGLRISIENPSGSTRSGTSPDGRAWSNTMAAHYGYVKGSEAADGDHVDVFVGPAAATSPTVYVVDQINPDGSYDEAKALFGFESEAEAVAAYRGSYDAGWKGGPVTAMSVDEFKAGLASGRFKKPLNASLAEAIDPAAEPAIAPKRARGVLAKMRTAKVQREPKAARAAREAEEAKVPAVATADSAKIVDFGEKIGGARKDRAEKTGSRTAAAPKDDRPAWARRFQVAQIAKDRNAAEVGRWVIRDTRSLDFMKQPRQVGRDNFATREDAEASIPLAAVSLKHRLVPTRDGRFEIWRDVTDRKRVKVVEQAFESREEALRYMAEKAQAIIETNTTFGEADLPRPAAEQRVGVERRTRDVKDGDFGDTFGFRGVEFGNWNNQTDRQQLLNDAYDGLLDLADVMGIPPRAISLEGELALAFGARGSGLSGARAHYEPAKAVINLTKMNGAGSLAHEWFHALDHYFGRQDGKASAEWVTDKDGTRSLKVSGAFEAEAASGGTRGERSGMRAELRDAYRSLMNTMTRKAERYVDDTAKADRFVASARDGVAKRLEGIRSGLAQALDARYYKRNNKPASTEQLAEFDTTAQQILDGRALDLRVENRGRGLLSGVRWTNDALERMSTIMKLVRGRSGFQSDGSGLLDRLRGDMQLYSSRLKMLADAQGGSEKTKFVPTQFAMDAKELDQGRGTDYWTTPHEMAARAFQGYVEDKIAERGGRSPFLNFGPEGAGISTPWGVKRPFPHGEERIAINEALDRLISTIQTREGEGGKTALFRRAGGVDGTESLPPAVANAMRALRPSYSPEARAQAVATVSKTVEAIRSAWGNGPDVVVAFDMSDPVVPEAARRADLKQRSGGARGAPEGFYYGGKAYLMASRLPSPNDAARVLFHEVLGHHGLRSTFGKSLQPILQQVATMRRAEVDAKIKEYGLRGVNRLDRMAAAEEVLAEMAQTRPDLHFVRRAIAAIRTWLRTHVPGFSNMRMTDDEIVRNFILPARRVVEQGGPDGGPGDGLRFNRGAVAPDPVNSLGAPIASTDQGVENFWRWYSAGDVNSNTDLAVAAGDPGRAAPGRAVDGGGVQDVDAVQRPGDMAANPGAPDQDGRVTFPGSTGPVGRDGTPVVFFHGTRDDFTAFDIGHPNRKDVGWLGRGVYGASDPSDATYYAGAKRGPGGSQVMPLYFAVRNPFVITVARKQQLRRATQAQVDAFTSQLKARGHDGAVHYLEDGSVEMVAFEPTQVKSAIGNTGAFSSTDPDIRFSRATVQGFAKTATAELNKTFKAPGKLSWWHRSVGTMYNLAERSPAFKGVFAAAQGFVDDVSYYANDAAELAPKLLPKLETWRDIRKAPVSAADNAAVGKPVFEGTLSWARDESGKAVPVQSLIDAAAELNADEKAQRLLRNGQIDERMLRAWKGMPLESYEKAVETRFESRMLQAGVVWSDAELRSMFNLTDGQIALYREFRETTDRSLDTMSRADMLRFAGDDAKALRDMVMDAPDAQAAAVVLRDHLARLASEQPDRSTLLLNTANGIIDRADKVRDLQVRGYAPLSRFGRYTVDVVDKAGERQYFGLFETAREANTMAARMREEFGESSVSQGTLSEEAFKLFAGVTPETLELFGNALGLDSTGDSAQDQAFQEYLRLTKTNRSAMRRLIHRKGIAGFSEDVGRVLAAFVYSNARQTAAGLHMGDLGEAVNAIPKEQGELKDVAVRLAEYVKNPQEEAQAVRGLLFAQYLGGSVASAFVNMRQPVAVTFPWLSQFGGARAAAAQIGRAAKDMAARGRNIEPELAVALKRAEAEGIVAPQEVHQLMAQARGTSTLRGGDGTRAGELQALGQNAMSRLSLAWGKLFGAAEQVNRRLTFIAAYRTAKAQGMADPAGFARKAITETQFLYSKANKMQWARGAMGGTLMTFKTYSVAYLELLHRMYTQGGPDGKRAALLALAVLLLMGGAGGLPFAEDLEDAADGLAQLLGYNFSTKKARQEFLEGFLPRGLVQFIDKGMSGLPGAPLDVSGRLGMGNLIPGTGMLMEKTSHARDVLEIAGPAGDFASRILSGARQILTGNVGAGVLEMSPAAVRNAAKGVDMAATGMYRDAKGYKVLDTNTLEAALKAIGFQPQSVAMVQEANRFGQGAKAFYNLRAQEIRALWAQGIFEGDHEKVREAREQVAAWNRRNPDQPMLIRVPDIMRRVREMRKSKGERIADTAPRALRQQLREEFASARQAPTM